MEEQMSDALIDRGNEIIGFRNATQALDELGIA